jgi:hypothetical protein
VRAYEAEFEVTSELDRSSINTAVTLTLKIEEMQAAQLRGEDVDADTLTKLAGQQRRAIADLKRRSEASAPAPPSILDHIAAGHLTPHEEDCD